jgi:acetate kinase
VKNNTLILVLNAGSSSLKFSLFRVGPTGGGQFDLQLSGQVEKDGKHVGLHVSDAAGNVLAKAKIAAGQTRWTESVLRFIKQWADKKFSGEQLIVGHRVVHGGTLFRQPVRITGRMLGKLEKLIPFDPLHLPVNLAAIRAVQSWNPAVLQVACFDTAFHRTHPQVADLSAIPWELYQSGVRRYGFHGLSYEYIASVLPKIAPRLARGRVVVAHLGSGASLCALKAGHSMDSTMGFSVLDGVPMGTRPGKIDSGILLYLLRQRGMTTAALESMLYRQSGLLGLSGISSDTRQLLASRQPRARLALEYFIYQVAREIAALASSLQGLDGLVFTGGIGEHSAEIRAGIMRACAWLGVKLDGRANRSNGPRISTAQSPVSVWVIPTNEELMIARHAWKLYLTNRQKN